MSDTLQNTPIPIETWVDVYTLITIDAGVPIQVQNIGTTDLYYSITETEPAQDSDFYKIFSRGESVVFNGGDLIVWIFSPQANGLVNANRFFSPTMDYFIEVAEGNIEGTSLFAIIAKNPSIGISYEDISGAGGDMSLAVSPEVYEIVSADANDTDGGTGTRTVLVNSLDGNYNEQSQVVTLNGGTVQLTGTHIRPRNIQSLTAGSNGTNIGNITLRVSGGGDVRNTMTPDSGQSYDGHFTVPAGKRAYILQTFSLFGKDDSGEVRTRFKLEGVDGSWVAIAPVPIYQNIIPFNVKALLAFPPKTDIRNQAKSESGTSDALVIFEYQLIDE